MSQFNPKALNRLQIFPLFLYHRFSFPYEFQFGQDICYLMILASIFSSMIDFPSKDTKIALVSYNMYALVNHY